MNLLTDLLGKFRKDDRGSVAVIFSLSVIVLVTTVGLAVDASRAYSVSSKLSAAADAAALAAAKLLDDENVTDAEVIALAQSYFNAHTANLGAGTLLSVNSVTADPNRAESSVTVTANVSVKTTFGQLAGVPSIDFQPTATVVYKVKKIELALVLDVTGSMNSNGKLAAMKTAAKDIVDILIEPGQPKKAVRIGLAPYAASVNAGTYAATVSGGASVDNCVVERTGALAETDDAPSSDFGVVSAPPPAPTSDYHYSCPPATILPITDDKDSIKTTIDSYGAMGWTAGQIGTAWGWYLVSENWDGIWPSASKPKSSSDPDVVKSVLIMTDGVFNTSYLTGIETPVATQATESYTQFQTLCTAMKGEGINIYTVGFEVTDPTVLDALRDCATSPVNYFEASNAAQLSAAFQAIANRLASLRITN